MLATFHVVTLTVDGERKVALETDLKNTGTVRITQKWKNHVSFGVVW